MYSNTHEFIFLHWGKCAGSSIKQALASVDGLEVNLKQWHTDLNTMKKLVKKDGFNPEKYLIFSCVRNPWDRMVSLYYHMKTLNKRPSNNPKIKKMHFKGTFEEFLHREGLHPPIQPNFEDFDHVIRYEFLQDDFNILCDKLNVRKIKLPNINYGTGRPNINYKSYYNSKTRQIVAERNSKIIEFFGYKF